MDVLLDTLIIGAYSSHVKVRFTVCALFTRQPHLDLVLAMPSCDALAPSAPSAFEVASTISK